MSSGGSSAGVSSWLSALALGGVAALSFAVGFRAVRRHEYCQLSRRKRLHAMHLRGDCSSGAAAGGGDCGGCGGGGRARDCDRKRPDDCDGHDGPHCHSHSGGFGRVWGPRLSPSEEKARADELAAFKALPYVLC
jgi:hypothetical protein